MAEYSEVPMKASIQSELRAVLILATEHTVQKKLYHTIHNMLPESALIISGYTLLYKQALMQIYDPSRKKKAPQPYTTHLFIA